MTVTMTEGARRSDAADRLEALVREWERLAPHANEPASRTSAKELSNRVVAHRATLFEANARIQAEATRDDDPAAVANTEANQDAIKACTTLLNEISAALGLTSIPG